MFRPKDGEIKVKCDGGHGCEREFYAPPGKKNYFCSFECAIYAGHFSVTKGFKLEDGTWEMDKKYES